jgi:hypothetical protein
MALGSVLHFDEHQKERGFFFGTKRSRKELFSDSRTWHRLWAMRALGDAGSGRCGLWAMRALGDAGSGRCGLWAMNERAKVLWFFLSRKNDFLSSLAAFACRTKLGEKFITPPGHGL